MEEPGIAPQMIGGEPTLPLKPHPNRKPKAIRTLLNNTNFKIKLVGLTVKYWQRGLQHFTFKLYSDQTVIYVLFFKTAAKINIVTKGLIFFSAHHVILVQP